MPDAKIDIAIGTISFHAEGEQQWVATQLDKLFVNAKELAVAAPVQQSQASGPAHTPIQPDPGIAGKPLATFLKEKGANSKQVLKFLATAVWIESKGKQRVSTADITKALKDSNQSKLGNPADCLNQNVKKGFCEKDGNEFFVTTQGKDSL